MSDKQPDPKVVNLKEREATQAPPEIDRRVTDADFLSRVVEATVQEIEARGPRVSPFDLNTYDDVIRFAEHTAKSGLCPKDFKNKPDDIISAVLWGKELGLPAMSALMSIAVINGRPTIWGEAVAALCYRTRLVENVDERFQGDGDDLTAICVVKRRNIESPKVGTFSVHDARTAGLFGSNVHKTYPRDMLMWKARHRAWHAAFPDTLRGLGTAEIAQEEADIPTWEMARPAHSWFVTRPQYQGGHDVTWLNKTEASLRAIGEPWEWMQALLTALEEAPTLTDVELVSEWPMISEMTEKAPPEPKARIAAAFVEARQRFATPEPPKPTGSDPATKTETKTDKAPPAKRERRPAPPATSNAEARRVDTQQSPASQEAAQDAQDARAAQFETPHTESTGPAFDYLLLDEQGDPVSDDMYESPLTWARTFAEYYAKAADPGAMCEHNADAITDARAQDPAADIVLSILDPPKEEEPEIAVVPLALDRGGKPNSAQYFRDMKAAAEAQTTESFLDWLAAQRETLDSVAQSTRLMVIKVIGARAAALGLPIPDGFTAPPAPAAQPDKDQKLAQTIVEHFDSLTDAHALRNYSNEQSVTVPLARWKRENPALATTVESAFAGRMAELNAGPGASR